MILTLKVKLNLNKEQESIVDLISNEGRLLYNHFLSKLKEQFEKDKSFIPYNTQQKELKDYKCEYLTYDIKKEILRNLYNNYSSYFKLMKNNKNLNSQSPKFRGKNYFFTISVVQDFIIKNDILKLSYLNRKKLEFKLDYIEPINNLICLNNKTKQSDIKQIKLSKKDNDYYVSISYQKTEDGLKDVDLNKIISIDLGKKNLVTLYDVENNKGIIYNSKYLSKNQKHFDKRTDELKSLRDKKVKFSRKHKQLNRKLKSIFNKKKTQTKLSLQKLSKDLSNQNKTILIGDLCNLKQNIKTEIKSLNRHMQNNWTLNTFIHLLEYKNKLRGNQVIKVNEAYTSKACCKCGTINSKLKLNDRHYKCDCGLNINRDVNGSINIYKQVAGDYNTPFETLKVSERFGWCNINQMNRNYDFYN
jgi:putative transposase